MPTNGQVAEREGGGVGKCVWGVPLSDLASQQQRLVEATTTTAATLREDLARVQKTGAASEKFARER